MVVNKDVIKPIMKLVVRSMPLPARLLFGGTWSFVAPVEASVFCMLVTEAVA